MKFNYPTFAAAVLVAISLASAAPTPTTTTSTKAVCHPSKAANSTKVVARAEWDANEDEIETRDYDEFIGDDELEGRDYDDELDARDYDEDLEARDNEAFADDDDELVARETDEFADEEQDLQARDYDDELETRDNEDELDARDYDDELEARDDDDELEAREYDDGLETRDHDDDTTNFNETNSTLSERAERDDKSHHPNQPQHKPKPKPKHKSRPAHPHKGKPKKAGPRYVVYADNWLSEKTFPSKKTLGGYTHFNLAFWMSHAPKDNALSWTQMSPASRKKLKKGLGNTKLMVSAFGATEKPTTQGKNAVKTAHSLAAFVKKHDFDGVDVDYEDLDAFNSGSGKAEKWLIDFTRTLRKELGPKKIISHAPLAPWFQPGGRWRGGGYLKVHKEVGKLINFYNIQFYNQGNNVYGTCKTLMEKSDHQFPKTSVMEIIKSGVPGSKIVVGKPAGKKDATNGFMGAKELGQCLKKYHGKSGLTGSAMVWQWANAGKKWVQAVRGTRKPHGKPHDKPHPKPHPKPTPKPSNTHAPKPTSTSTTKHTSTPTTKHTTTTTTKHTTTATTKSATTHTPITLMPVPKPHA